MPIDRTEIVRLGEDRFAQTRYGMEYTRAELHRLRDNIERALRMDGEPVSGEPEPYVDSRPAGKHTLGKY